MLVVYESTAQSDAAYVADAESLDVRWFDVPDIPWLDLAFDTTAAALRDWTARHPASAR